jgi:hypothetical protein
VKFERGYARALTSPDPVAAIRALSRDREVDADTRARLAVADADGIRLSALLITRLRFERLLRASPEAERWFDEDPQAFTAAFRDYHHSVPPTSFFPRDEAAAFAKWNAKAPAAAPRRSPRRR